MIKNYHIYVIPPRGAILSEKDPSESDWEINHANYDSNGPYAYYFEEYKKLVRDEIGHEWIIVFRKYNQLGGVSFVIYRSDKQLAEDTTNSITQGTESPEDINKLFYRYKKECGVGATASYSKYELKLFGSETELDKEATDFDYLFSEKFEGNVLLIKAISVYLNLNFDSLLSEQICNNIIILLSLSEISFSLIAIFLSREDTESYQSEVIKSFWGYKSYLLKCPASKVFPLFFKDKVSIIDNLLDYRHMEIVDKQKDLLDQQKDLLDKLKDLLEEINKVESTILLLTFLVIIEVVFNVSSEILKQFFHDIPGWPIAGISLIMGIILAFVIWIRMKGRAGHLEGIEWHPGYVDCMYDVIDKSRQYLKDQRYSLIVILAIVAFSIILIMH